MSHPSIHMPDDMAIDIWLQTLNDELNEMLARDGRDDVTDLLQQRYGILKRLAIASVKREPLNIPEGWKLVPIVATEEMCHEGDDCQEYDPRMDESESYYTWTAMINAAPPPPFNATTASRDGK